MSRIALVAILAASALTSMPAREAAAQQAGAATLIGKFGDWQAFQSGDGDGKVCFALSRPTERLPAGLNRDPASFFVTHRPGQGVRNEVSMTVGFPMREAQDAVVRIGNASFAMYTKDANAWVRNAADEPVLLEAMRRGRTLSFAAVSRRGNNTTDNYSLIGLTDALNAIASNCP